MTKVAELVRVEGRGPDSMLAPRPPRAEPASRTSPQYEAAKRALDIAVALAALIFLAPVMLVVAGLVAADGGSAIFGHSRIGAGGQAFKCLKFRSMCTDAEQRLQALLRDDPEARAEWARDHKLKHDPRITLVGAFLRKSSLDELPQLFNVLRGEMSIVGPRPIVSDEVGRYGRRIRDYHSCKPGITGLWQVSGRNDVCYRRRVAMDAVYAQRRSLSLDMAILVRTVPAVLMRSGSY